PHPSYAKWLQDAYPICASGRDCICGAIPALARDWPRRAESNLPMDLPKSLLTRLRPLPLLEAEQSAAHRLRREGTRWLSMAGTQAFRRAGFQIGPLEAFGREMDGRRLPIGRGYCNPSQS